MPEPVSPRARRWLAGIVAGASVIYGWGLADRGVHPYYSAAVRTMSRSWSAFAFGAIDAHGSMTVDKVPGALWIQALFVRGLGFHPWVMLLPELLAALAASVLLFDTVRRWSGERAALAATAIFATSPAVVLVARVNLPEIFLVLALVAAANAHVRALQSHRIRPLLACAAWIGIGFQFKMLQAFLVLPVLLVTYVIAARPPLAQRARRAGLAVLTSIGVAAVWPVAMALTPAAHRPFIDGSANNSVWELVFVYNGLGRFGSNSSVGEPGTVAGFAPPLGGAPGWLRLFDSETGLLIAWLLPAAVACLVIGLVRTRRRPWADAMRIGWVTWGAWLAVHAVVFSTASGMQPYYTAVLAPAIAALAGTGAAQAAERWLGAPGLSVTEPSLTDRGQLGAISWRPFVHAACVALLVVPALLVRVGADVSTGQLAALWTVPSTHVEGISATRAAATTESPPATTLADSHVDHELLAFVAARSAAGVPLAVTDADLASRYILAGFDVMPFGGFTGTAPHPSVDRVADLVSRGTLRYVLRAGHGPVARSAAGQWVITNCRVVPISQYAPGRRVEPTQPSLYDCA